MEDVTGDTILAGYLTNSTEIVQQCRQHLQGNKRIAGAIGEQGTREYFQNNKPECT